MKKINAKDKEAEKQKRKAEKEAKRAEREKRRKENRPTPEEAAIRVAKINQTVAMVQAVCTIGSSITTVVLATNSLKNANVDLKKLKLQKAVNESATTLCKELQQVNIK